MLQLGTDQVQSNQNITAAHLCGSYTNPVADNKIRKIHILLCLDQIAGNGDYIAYLMRQRAGTGNNREIGPRTTYTVASGVLNIEFDSITVIAGVADVISVYVIGLGGDTTTPDITLAFYEDDTYSPTSSPTGNGSSMV